MVATQYSAERGIEVEEAAPDRYDGTSSPGLLWSGDGALVIPTTRRGVRPRAVRPSPAWHYITKRAIDLILGTVLLVAAVPVLVVAAVLIKFDSPGPVLFTQVRAGRHRRSFSMLKLRTMVENAEEELESVRHLNEADGPLFKISDDPRVTRVGRILRATSIDELPQLWNVVRGQMSLVGPRPALPHEVDDWPRYVHRRLEVRPGVTGLWQISGRSELSFDDYVTYDLVYVESWTPARDLAILARTIPVVVNRRGAH